MKARNLLSYPFALFLAFVVTMSIFLMMYKLIHRDAGKDQMLDDVAVVELFQPEDQEPEPEQQDEPDQEPEEPLLEELVVKNPLKAPSMDVDIEPMAIDMGNIDVQTSGNWSPPAVGEVATGNADGAGQSNAGYREVIPLGTRQPNVPKIAWENKIDGWVLASFIVKPNGRVTNIRIMDSHPRGVFEENVIASIERWIYEPLDGPPIQLTQKIELFWKDYPNNIRQLR